MKQRNLARSAPILIDIYEDEDTENLPPMHHEPPRKKQKKYDLPVEIKNEVRHLNDITILDVVVLIENFEQLNRRFPLPAKWNGGRLPPFMDKPVVCVSTRIPIFLKRTHRANRMVNFDLRALSYDTSFKPFLRIKPEKNAAGLKKSKRFGKVVDERQNRLDHVINEVKMQLSLKLYLAEEHVIGYIYPVKDLLPSGNFVLLEFCQLQSPLLMIEVARAEIAVFGVDSSTGNVLFEEPFCIHWTSTSQKLCEWKSEEYILPKPTADFDELYLFVEIKERLNSRCAMRVKSRTGTSSSSSSSSSTPTRAFGALRLAKKKVKDNYHCEWNINYTAKAIHLLDAQGLARNDLRATRKELRDKLKLLAKRADVDHQKIAGQSLVMELQNARGFGSFTKEQVLRKSIKSPKKEKKALPKEDKENGSPKIRYDLSACDKQDCILVVDKGMIKMPKLYNTANRFGTLLDAEVSNSLIAHKANGRSFVCVFCSKTFSSLEALKFHLVYSYPSFEFKFTPTSIKVTFDKEQVKRSLEKLKENRDEALIKNESGIRGSQRNVEPSKRIMPVNRCIYTKPEITTYPGLHRIEMNYEPLNTLVLKNMTEIKDLEPKEIEFYFLWNAFLLRAENRVSSSIGLPKALIKFIKANANIIEKKGLRLTWITFLSHFRENSLITEAEFLEAGFVGTKFQFQ